MIVVQFENGNYGVMRKRWWGRKEFLSPSLGWWWHEPGSVSEYCQMSKEQAFHLAGVGTRTFKVIDERGEP